MMVVIKGAAFGGAKAAQGRLGISAGRRVVVGAGNTAAAAAGLPRCGSGKRSPATRAACRRAAPRRAGLGAAVVRPATAADAANRRITVRIVLSAAAAITAGGTAAAPGGVRAQLIAAGLTRRAAAAAPVVSWGRTTAA
jgi:hypothetical protein